MNVEQKLDKIVDTLGQQAITLERLTVTVEDHVRRTNILEEDIKPIKNMFGWYPVWVNGTQD